jgi:hypothetical protein
MNKHHLPPHVDDKWKEPELTSRDIGQMGN